MPIIITTPNNKNKPTIKQHITILSNQMPNNINNQSHITQRRNYNTTNKKTPQKHQIYA